MPELLFDAPCPWCGAKAVDITTQGEDRRRFVCTGAPPGHEWLEGEGPVVVEEPEPAEEPDAEFYLRAILEELRLIRTALFEAVPPSK